MWQLNGTTYDIVMSFKKSKQSTTVYFITKYMHDLKVLKLGCEIHYCDLGKINITIFC